MLLALILLSFLGTNGPMLYFLHRLRHDRKPFVSHHMATSKRTNLVYALGHFVGGMAYLYFAYKYFYKDRGETLLFILSFFGVAVEQVQAFFPNNLVYKKIHTVAAVAMGAFIATILLSAPVLISLKTSWLIAYISLIFFLLGAGVYTIFNKNKFYRAQMLFFCSFHVFLFILLYGAVG
jgi:VanZ family protein